MKDQIDYLFALKDECGRKLEAKRKKLDRMRSIIFGVALFILTLQFLNIKLREVNLMGFKIEIHDSSKFLFIIPIILTYQFAHYYLTKMRERKLQLTSLAIQNEIELTVGAKLNDICQQRSSKSSRGTTYNIFHSTLLVKLGSNMMKAITWLPVVLAFSIGAVRGLNNALISTDIYYKWLYISTLCTCISVILITRIAASQAYRVGRKKQQE